jgi:CRISPR-associated exonuclease Cas4
VGAPSLTPTALAAVVIVAGALVSLWAARALAVRRREARIGRLLAIDAGAPVTLRSNRYRIQGRPDVLRETPDGRWVPVELKSRPAPSRGPTRSHVVQVWAYCLLVEETTGRPPPFGVLRYADAEFRIPWDGPARSELLRVREELARPYDGRANPSAARCARCPWVGVCDVRYPGV